MKKLLRDIETQKAKLIAKAKKTGIYENFGQREVLQLKDKYIDSSNYYSEMNAMRGAISTFDDWCSSYCG
jgi:hypothetical protein